MASNNEKKPTGQNLFGLEDEAWDDLLDEWTEHLPLDEASAKTEPAPDGSTEGPVDPMVALVADGEIEIPESAGAALGDLLGASSPTEGQNDAVDDVTLDYEDDAITHERPLVVTSSGQVATREDTLPEITRSATGPSTGEVVDEARIEAANPLSPPELPDDLDDDTLHDTLAAAGPKAKARRLDAPVVSLAGVDDILPAIGDDGVSAGDALPAAIATPPIPASGPSIFDDIDPSTPEPPLTIDHVAAGLLPAIEIDATRFPEHDGEPPAYGDHELWLSSIDRAVDAADSTRKASYLAFGAANFAEATGRIGEARGRYEDVLNHRPDCVAALQSLQRLRRADQDESGEVEVVAQLAEAIGGKLGERLRLQVADHAWLRAGDDDAARAALKGARGLRAAMLLVDLAVASGDDAAQIEALKSLAATIVSDGPSAGAAHATRGRLLESLGDQRSAKDAFRDATNADDACRAGWEGLARTARALRQHEAFADAIRGGSELLGSWHGRSMRRRAVLIAHGLVEGDAIQELQWARDLDERAELLLLMELGQQLRVSRSMALGSALTNLVEHATNDASKVDALYVAAAQAEAREDADDALELLHSAHEIQPRAPLIERSIARLRAADPDPSRRLGAYRAAAEAAPRSEAADLRLRAASVLRRDLYDDEGAVEEYRSALRVDPGCVAAQGGLRTTLTAGDRLAELASALRDIAAASEDVTRAVTFACDAAQIEAERGEVEAAISTLDLALDRDSDAWLARHRMARVLSQSGRHEQLTTFMSRFYQPSALVTCQLGELAALGERWDEAIRWYEKSVAADAVNERARWGTIRLAARREMWDEVVAQLEAMADARSAAGDERGARALLLRIAAYRSGPLRDLEGALSALEEAASEGDAPEGALAALRRVERWVGDGGYFTKDIASRLSHARDIQERRALLLANAEGMAAEGRPRDDVVQRLRDALALDPADPTASIALQETFFDAGDWQAFEDCVRQQVDVVGDRRFEEARFDELAEVAIQREDRAAAAQWLEAVTRVSVDTVGPLRQRALALAGDAGAAHEVGVVVRKIAARARASVDRFALYYDLGRRLYTVRSPEGPEADAASATDAFARSLEAESTSRLAARTLVETARRSGDTSRIADAYAACAAHTEDALSAVLWRVAASEARGEGEREALAALAEVTPDDLAAVRALRDLALREGLWEGALHAIHLEATTTALNAQAVKAHMLAGAIAEEQLARADLAAKHYQSALERAPTHAEAFDRLTGILEGSGRWAELTKALTTRVDGVDGDEERAALHRRVAAVALEKLEDRALAREHLEALLALSPEDADALDLCAKVYEQENLWDAAATALIKRARLEKRREPLRQYLIRLGRIYQDKAPDHQKAILSFNKALSLDSNDREVLSRLSDLYMDDLQHEAALGVTERLLAIEPLTESKVDHLLRIGKLYEDGLKDGHRAAQALRRANELAPADLRAIGALCGFYARQGDQRSVMIHLDRAQTNMRSRLEQDPFEEFAYRALYKIFGWRKNPDGMLCAARVLQLLGHVNADERTFIDRHVSGVGDPGATIGAAEHDEWLFRREIPSGFRHLFRLLSEPLGRLKRVDLRKHGVGRADRLGTGHPVRGIADLLARDFGVGSLDCFISQSKPHIVIVENTNPPALILGKELVQGASEHEIRFLVGRCLWIIRKAMILPARFPQDVDMLVAGVVRQYVPDFEPPNIEPKKLVEMTKQVGRVIPRKLKQELMPFALECSGEGDAIGNLGAAIVHSANRAGLLACRSISGAVSALAKAAGQKVTKDISAALVDNPEAEELLRFSVSDAHFELRRGMNIAIR